MTQNWAHMARHHDVLEVPYAFVVDVCVISRDFLFDVSVMSKLRIGALADMSVVSRVRTHTHGGARAHR